MLRYGTFRQPRSKFFWTRKIYKKIAERETHRRQRREGTAEDYDRPDKTHINESYAKDFSVKRPYSFKEQVLLRHRSPLGIMYDVM